MSFRRTLRNLGYCVSKNVLPKHNLERITEFAHDVRPKHLTGRVTVLVDTCGLEDMLWATLPDEVNRTPLSSAFVFQENADAGDIHVTAGSGLRVYLPLTEAPVSLYLHGTCAGEDDPAIGIGLFPGQWVMINNDLWRSFPRGSMTTLVMDF